MAFQESSKHDDTPVSMEASGNRSLYMLHLAVQAQICPLPVQNPFNGEAIKLSSYLNQNVVFSKDRVQSFLTQNAMEFRWGRDFRHKTSSFIQGNIKHSDTILVVFEHHNKQFLQEKQCLQHRNPSELDSCSG